MNIYNALGYGFLEIVYKDVMEIEFLENKILYIREKEFPIIYNGIKLKRTFFADFLLLDKIIVEVKANGEGISTEAISQTINYQKTADCRVGLINNKKKNRLEYKRVVF